jgi:hypothetical protein
MSNSAWMRPQTVFHLAHVAARHVLGEMTQRATPVCGRGHHWRALLPCGRHAPWLAWRRCPLATAWRPRPPALPLNLALYFPLALSSLRSEAGRASAMAGWPSSPTPHSRCPRAFLCPTACATGSTALYLALRATARPFFAAVARCHRCRGRRGHLCTRPGHSGPSQDMQDGPSSPLCPLGARPPLLCRRWEPRWPEERAPARLPRPSLAHVAGPTPAVLVQVWDLLQVRLGSLILRDPSFVAGDHHGGRNHELRRTALFPAEGWSWWTSRSNSRKGEVLTAKSVTHVNSAVRTGL